MASGAAFIREQSAAITCSGRGVGTSALTTQQIEADALAAKKPNGSTHRIGRRSSRRRTGIARVRSSFRSRRTSYPSYRATTSTRRVPSCPTCNIKDVMLH